MNHRVIQNSLIAGTVSSGGSFLFFAFQGVRIAIPFVWAWAVLAALAYGLLATKLSIYGKGSKVFSNWKNVLLTLVLFTAAQVGCLEMYPIFGASPGTSIGTALAVIAAMAVSDVLAG